MKNKLSLLTFCLWAILILGACSKNNNTPSGGGGGGNNNTSSITPSTATSYYGILSVLAVQSYYYGTLFPATNLSSAYFSNTPTPYNNTSTFVKVNSVSLNGKVFKFGSYYYQDSTNSEVYPPGTWVVNGLANIPSFTYTATNPIPTYTNYLTLPDTVYKTQSITIPITGISGSDQTTIIISDGTNGTGHVVAQTLLPGANSVTFQAATLSGLTVSSPTTTTTAFINVGLQKNNVQSVNGLPMNFVSQYQFDKPIYIK
jgi:hypothetical protein